MVFAIDGSVVTTDYAGCMTVVDDDPTPTAEIGAVAATVDGGPAVRLRVRLSEPVDYHAGFNWRVVRAPGKVPQRGEPIDVDGVVVTAGVRDGG